MAGIEWVNSRCRCCKANIGVFDQGAGGQIWSSADMCGGRLQISLINMIPLNHFRNQFTHYSHDHLKHILIASASLLLGGVGYAIWHSDARSGVQGGLQLPMSRATSTARGERAIYLPTDPSESVSVFIYLTPWLWCKWRRAVGLAKKRHYFPRRLTKAQMPHYAQFYLCKVSQNIKTMKTPPMRTFRLRFAPHALRLIWK